MRTPATSISEVGHEELVAVLKAAFTIRDGDASSTPDEVLHRVADGVLARLTKDAGPPRPGETTFLIDHCVALASTGADLAAVTEGFHAALHVLMRHLWSRAAPNDQTRLLRVNAWCVAIEAALAQKAHHALARATSTVVCQRQARSELAAALVAGDPICATGTTSATITLPDTYAVVYLLAPSGRVLSQGMLPTSSVRADVLSTPADDRDLILLVPCGSGTPSRLDVRALIAELTAGTGVPVSAGMAWPDLLSGVPDAVLEARTIARLAAATDQAGGCSFDDVLVEWALSHTGPARRRLAGLLARLSSGPDLLATLEALYKHDLDRTAAASAMHVHRATLDYRLKKIQEVCGFDPLTTRGVRTLASALFSARFDAAQDAVVR
ncbi:helix-turn-helix domain-containing protein [Streptomyces sp. ID05-26A]|nr:helix-turn-helix domain-containing protein [Streptomyces sp. ID05-26A]